MFQQIKHFEANKDGRDFVVGDLHGCFDELAKLLEYVQFNNKVDRLFSVGDLIDRGPKSLECAALLLLPWVHAVCGNHEDFMINTVLRDDSWTAQNWMINGGIWYAQLSPEKKELADHIAELMAQLPYVITVGDSKNGRFNIVHAELYHNVDVVPPEKDMHPMLDQLFNTKQRVQLTDRMIDDWVFNDHEQTAMLWGRDLCAGETEIAAHSADEMSLTFVGHTPMHDVIQIGQQMYIDTGAVYYHLGNKHSDRALILVEPAKSQFHRYGLLSGLCTTLSFDSVDKRPK